MGHGTDGRTGRRRSEIRPGARYVFTCGLVGVRQDGTYEQGVEAQAARIFENLKILLAEAHMDMGDVVKIISYMVDLREQPAYAKARKPYLGDAHPAMTQPEFNKFIAAEIVRWGEVIKRANIRLD